MMIRVQILCLLILLGLSAAVHGAEIDGRVATLIDGAKNDKSQVSTDRVQLAEKLDDYGRRFRSLFVN